MSSELARVELLRAVFAAGASGREGVELDLGDDAAVLSPSSGRLVLSVDAHVEGVHFRRSWLSPREIGARAAAAALSDLAAMAARADVALLSLALPAGLSDDELEGLALGVRDACDEASARVVGGNLTRASELSLHTTVVGRLAGPAITRAGARVGHGVYVTGTVGEAALGLAALEAGRGEEPQLAPFVARWKRPRPRIVEGQRIGELASALIDVSDGLVIDVERIARASGVRIRLDASALPLARGFVEACAALGRDPLSLALGGGEDYELAFTAPVSVGASKVATQIGVVVDGPVGAEVDGASELAVAGFDHFR